MSPHSRFIMDDYGNFCIEVEGVRSEPTTYAGIARVKVGNDIYIGVSAYYECEFPHETVLKVTPVSPMSENVEVSGNLFHQRDLKSS